MQKQQGSGITCDVAKSVTTCDVATSDMTCDGAGSDFAVWVP